MLTKPRNLCLWHGLIFDCTGLRLVHKYFTEFRRQGNHRVLFFIWTVNWCIFNGDSRTFHAWLVTVSCLGWNFSFWPGNWRIVDYIGIFMFEEQPDLYGTLSTVTWHEGSLTCNSYSTFLYIVDVVLSWAWQICMGLGFLLSHWFSRLENRDALLFSFNILSRQMMRSMRWMVVLEWQFSLVLFKSLMGKEEMSVGSFHLLHDARFLNSRND